MFYSTLIWAHGGLKLIFLHSFFEYIETKQFRIAGSRDRWIDTRTRTHDLDGHDAAELSNHESPPGHNSV